MKNLLLAVFILLPFTAFAVEVGQDAPVLVARGADGEEFDLHELKGKIIIVNFWASWCPPCRKEMPVLDKFVRTHDVEIIGINTDGELDGWDKKLGYKLFLPKQLTENGFGMPRELPITYIIDTELVVRAKIMSEDVAITEEKLDKIVKQLVKN